MSYIVEQKIKGNIYLCEVESYWDKKKKQARQRRKYIGPKNAKKVQNQTKKVMADIKKFWKCFFAEFSVKQIGYRGNTQNPLSPMSLRDTRSCVFRDNRRLRIIPFPILD